MVPSQTIVCQTPSELELLLEISELDHLKPLFINKYSTSDDLLEIDLDSIIENVADCQKLKLALQEVNSSCPADECEADLELDQIDQDLQRIDAYIEQIVQSTNNRKTFIKRHTTTIVAITAFVAVIGCFLFIKRKR
ncbi:unnamed protein product [Didymodactylos carnosus]|uniref:Uncharacterized protein n=1 Tax=Didymodactylos carnosus TaxID=1234261 RepID=A0A815KLY9_9BILA|nr:unnamed protein product [Didymodactylos carnosus]CAF4289276.1 unnamed protein product [Didymodactylos carnosus]